MDYCHIICIVFHLKTTLNIDDAVMIRLRQEAIHQGRTMSLCINPESTTGALDGAFNDISDAELPADLAKIT